jgi:hypothetical protein
MRQVKQTSHDNIIQSVKLQCASKSVKWLHKYKSFDLVREILKIKNYGLNLYMTKSPIIMMYTIREILKIKTYELNLYTTKSPIIMYTGSPRRNLLDFGRVFFTLRYADITPKHPRPKLNSYRDNGQRKLWSSGRSTHCTCDLTSLIEVCPSVWYPMMVHTSLQGTLRCAANHVMLVLAIHVSCIVLGTLRTTITWCASFFVVQFNGFMSFTSYFDVTYIINITETTHSCQF